MDARFDVMVSTIMGGDSRQDGRVSIRISDRISSECLATWDMPPGRWWRLITGLAMTVDGQRSPHMDRVGKRMETRLLKVPEEVLPRFGNRRESDEVKSIVESWAREQVPAGEEFEPRRQNDGWHVVVRWWVTDPAVVSGLSDETADL